MKNTFTRLSLTLTILAFSIFIGLAQPGNNGDPMQYIKRTFPKLTNLYEDDLRNCHTHYIFAIDVSGSMTKYDSTVTPALQAFARALPEGEQISIMPFGTDVKVNVPGLCCKIHGPQDRNDLINSLIELYSSPSYTPEFKRNTDIKKVVEAINKTLLNNREVQMNIIVIITDFLNDIPGKGEAKLNGTDLPELNKNFENLSEDKYTRVVAMQLPKAGTGKGFCLDQLQNSVFCKSDELHRFDIVPVIKNQGAIAHWFEQLTREIMTEKLKAVIQVDNVRNLHPQFDTEIDIDGNTKANISWNPNKLYSNLKIDTTKTADGSDYYFSNNEKAFQVTTESEIKDLKLGKLKHKNWGLHRYNENLDLGLSLPTDYDDELKMLSIDKPLAASSNNKSGWLWTFFLPFWLSVTILVILIIYAFMVIKTIKRNVSARFIGTVDFTDSRGRDINDTPIRVRTQPGKTLLIGNGGNCGCDLNSDWQIKIKKKTYNPLLVWKRPAFEWSAASGFVRNGNNKKRGFLGLYQKNGTSARVNLECGKDSNSITHGVKIVIKKN
jgi:hypothetical protein